MDPRDAASKSVRVLFEDEHLLAVDKPAGLRVGGPGLGATEGGELIARALDCGPLHPVRPLEQHVSGVLVLAKSETAAAQLARSMASPRTKSEYVAVVSGQPKRPSPSRASGARSKRPSFPLRLVRRRKKLSLIWLRHDSPRTSQVRADLQAIGLVPLGDARRRRGESTRRPGGRLFLHRSQMLFPHPVTGKTVAVEAPQPRVFQAALTGGDLVEDLLEVALTSRLSCLLDGDTDSWRLHTGRPEGIPGLAAEKLGPVIILQTHQGKFMGDIDRVRRIGKWYKRTFGATAVYHKRFVKDRSRSARAGDEARDPKPLIGRPVPEEVPIRENGLHFLIRPYDGYSPGLFLDHRDNRRRVRELAAGRRVLNAFAYTCGFSVAAAAGGASHTVSVDISKKSLEWGKRNFAANGLDAGGHTFICSEIFDYFRRARRQKRSFDLIILDAPTFARSKRPARVFGIASDLQPLITEALAVLAPGGFVLCSTNSRSQSAAWLRDQIAAAAAQAGQRFQITVTPSLPVDFAADSGYAKTVIARFP
jgi:23S rRNA (cytosine1962-C5)-methyltransferase